MGPSNRGTGSVLVPRRGVGRGGSVAHASGSVMKVIEVAAGIIAHEGRYLIARRLGLGDAFAEDLLMAAPMHDVGKLGIPDSILLKPGKLTPEEFAVMKRHPQIGHDILKDSSSSILRLGATIALTHHEKFDGSGYPHGLAGESIPIEGRIVAVADVFDALTSARPYKPAWPMSRAVALLREGRGTHFDPACVDALFHAWDQVLSVQMRYQDEHEPEAPFAPAG